MIAATFARYTIWNNYRDERSFSDPALRRTVRPGRRAAREKAAFQCGNALKALVAGTFPRLAGWYVLKRTLAHG